ncbi:MAG TPA: OmpH family outer membrane protein [Chitinophagaceae bacterium]|nr:OmpH family outer membrane protein [Chitinophagaceae bacterium]
MRLLTTLCSVLALAGVLVLFILQFNGKKNTRSTHASPVGGKPASGGVKIGFVDIDTLEANYGYFKQKKTEFENRQKNIDAELEKMSNSIQSDYLALQKRAQAGSLPESEAEEAQQRLMQRQQELELKRQTLGARFLKDQEAFNKEIHDNLHAYIEKYNDEMGYDYILSYSKDGSILFANPALDITQDIIEGMNEDSKAGNTSKK